jgi:hypothetical protein
MPKKLFFVSIILVGLLLVLIYFSRPSYMPSIEQKTFVQLTNETKDMESEEKLEAFIDQQRAESEYRKNNPPTEIEISDMMSNRLLCYHNADCRYDVDYIGTACNGLTTNNYYCLNNTCDVTMMGCMESPYLYATCQDNKCVEERIEGVTSRGFSYKSKK